MHPIMHTYERLFYARSVMHSEGMGAQNELQPCAVTKHTSLRSLHATTQKVQLQLLNQSDWIHSNVNYLAMECRRLMRHVHFQSSQFGNGAEKVGGVFALSVKLVGDGAEEVGGICALSVKLVGDGAEEVGGACKFEYMYQV